MTAIECVVEDEAWLAAGDLETLAAEAITAAEAELSLPGGKGVCILFAGDEAIADLNAAHRGKTGPTNVLSFPAHDSAEGWLGDIALKPQGQGRFGGAGGVPEWWVLWLDHDNRTAAIGTPGGEFGWIMDRAPKGGADRIRAAKQIMQWSGYDMAHVKE